MNNDNNYYGYNNNESELGTDNINNSYNSNNQFMGNSYQSEPNNSYQNNEYQNNSYKFDRDQMSVGQWIITYLLLMVPCVNIVCLFVWAFGNELEPRRNYARANLIIMIVGIILITIFYGSFISIIKGSVGAL